MADLHLLKHVLGLRKIFTVALAQYILFNFHFPHQNFFTELSVQLLLSFSDQSMFVCFPNIAVWSNCISPHFLHILTTSGSALSLVYHVEYYGRYFVNNGEFFKLFWSFDRKRKCKREVFQMVRKLNFVLN